MACRPAGVRHAQRGEEVRVRVADQDHKKPGLDTGTGRPVRRSWPGQLEARAADLGECLWNSPTAQRRQKQTDNSRQLRRVFPGGTVLAPCLRTQRPPVSPKTIATRRLSPSRTIGARRKS